MSVFYTVENDKITLKLRLTPSAARDALGGIHLDANGQAWLKASVTTVPEKGKANKALITLLSKQQEIRKTAFSIISGETDRHKTIAVADTGDGVVNALKNLSQT